MTSAIITHVWLRAWIAYWTKKMSLLRKQTSNGFLDVEEDAGQVHFDTLRRLKEKYGSNDSADDPIRRASIKFNNKPKNGIEFLVTSGLVSSADKADEVAKFLFECETLSMTKLGDFLSEPNNGEILRAYCDRFDFTGKAIDHALRAFLSKFRLPGEAQKIDRIMEQFARRFCVCNPDIFPTSDTAYVLAFAIIMLNTDAHNKSIKNKMSKKDFVANNRGIANGKDLPQSYLENLYDSILSDEIKLNTDLVFAKAVRKGWLEKQGTNGSWQRRWFVVANNCLYYCSQPEDKDPRVIIPLEGLQVMPNTEFRGRTCFELFDPNQGKMKSVKLTPSGPTEGTHDRFVFAVEKAADADEWIKAVQSNIVTSPVAQLLAKKKQTIARAQQQPPPPPPLLV